MTLPVNRAIIVERFEKAATHGPVAQLGERRVRIAEAEGSNPFGSTKTEAPVSSEKLGLFLCLCGFSGFLQFANIALYLRFLAFQWHRKNTVKYPLPAKRADGVFFLNKESLQMGAFGCVPTCLFPFATMCRADGGFLVRRPVGSRFCGLDRCVRMVRRCVDGINFKRAVTGIDDNGPQAMPQTKDRPYNALKHRIAGQKQENASPRDRDKAAP